MANSSGGACIAIQLLHACIVDQNDSRCTHTHCCTHTSQAHHERTGAPLFLCCAVYRLIATPCATSGFSTKHPQLFQMAASSNSSFPGTHLLSGILDVGGYGPTCVQSCTICAVDYPQGVGALLGYCWAAAKRWTEATTVGNRDTFKFLQSSACAL